MIKIYSLCLPYGCPGILGFGGIAKPAGRPGGGAAGKPGGAIGKPGGGAPGKDGFGGRAIPGGAIVGIAGGVGNLGG